LSYIHINTVFLLFPLNTKIIRNKVKTSWTQTPTCSLFWRQFDSICGHHFYYPMLPKVWVVSYRWHRKAI